MSPLALCGRREPSVGDRPRLTLLGGEPMEPENQRALLPFLRRVRERYGRTKTVWVYTGCVWDERTRLLADPVYCTEATAEILSLADVLVDGPFVESLKDISLRFRGSSNQRIINLNDRVEPTT